MIELGLGTLGYKNVFFDYKSVREGKFNIDEFETKAEYSPFDGWNYTGTAVMTIVNGKVVMDKL
jgi:dihydroorotase-like cyclic amidohydrolase